MTLAKIHFKNNRPREGIAVLERLLQSNPTTRLRLNCSVNGSNAEPGVASRTRPKYRLEISPDSD